MITKFESLNIKKQELVLKILICIMGAFTISMTISAFIIEKMTPETLGYKICSFLIITGVIMGIVIFFIVIYLGEKVHMSKKTIPQKMKLLSDDYTNFYDLFLKQLSLNGYSEVKEITTDMNFRMEYIVNPKFSEYSVVLIVKVDELTEDVEKKYLDYFIKYITKEKRGISSKRVNLIHIVCVEKENECFKNFVRKNIIQGYEKYQLPVGISFDKKMIYIVTQDGGDGRKFYKKMIKLFKEYISNQSKEINK